MSNGCGCESGLLKHLRPPYAKMFKEACNRHDDDYDRGGHSFDRWIADVDLFERMVFTIHMQEWKPLRVTWLTMIAYLYFISIRWFGWMYYNYKKD